MKNIRERKEKAKRKRKNEERKKVSTCPIVEEMQRITLNASFYQYCPVLFRWLLSLPTIDCMWKARACWP